ncbi:hypothetical protein ACHAO8_004119 [Botrytis cinerea]
MAPLRRYLRISKYSVLECRIYVDNPALAESWLLNPRNPVLPRVIEKVRPLVLPKLREEQERSKSKGKKKGVKDVVSDDRNKKALQSNSDKLTGNTNDAPIEVADGPAIVREASEESFSLQDIPEVGNDSDLFVSEDEGPRGSKRSRIGRDSTDSDFGPLAKRRKDGEISEDDDDDKKKMAMDTSYDGFSVNGRVLCLVVKRKDKKGKAPAASGGQAMMEDWITSTQMPPQLEDV